MPTSAAAHFYPPYEQKRHGHWRQCWHSEKLYVEAVTGNGVAVSGPRA